MEQQAKEGSLILPNDKNLQLFTELFKLYVTGKLVGLVLLISDDGRDVGIQMDGVPPAAPELTIGKYTMLWGTYLEPEYRGKGITHEIYKVAMEWTHKNGFTGGISGILVGDQRVEQVLSKVVDNTHGATKTRPYTVDVCWEFEKPSSV